MAADNRWADEYSCVEKIIVENEIAGNCLSLRKFSLFVKCLILSHLKNSGAVRAAFLRLQTDGGRHERRLTFRSPNLFEPWKRIHNWRGWFCIKILDFWAFSSSAGLFNAAALCSLVTADRWALKITDKKHKLKFHVDTKNVWRKPVELIPLKFYRFLRNWVNLYRVLNNL